MTSERAAPTPPTGFRRFTQEIALTLGFTFLTFWMLALLTHSPQDAAWTTSGNVQQINNWGGRLGAWLGDMSFFLAGYSVLWTYVAALMTWLNALATRLRGESDDPEHEIDGWVHTRWAFWSGNILLLLSSTGLEWTRLYRFEGSLPGHHAGGVIGFLVGQFGMNWFGFNGSCLIFIAFMMVSLSWVFRFSWIHLAENIGAFVDHFIQVRREKKAREEDIAMGLAAAKERDAVLHGVKADAEAEHTGAHINIRIQKEPEPVVAPKSERLARERQKPLFNDLPDSKLPQVDLLDANKSKVDTVSTETLEVTSRLIEKKLKDFGVEVHVVEASPGRATRLSPQPALKALKLLIWLKTWHAL